MPEKPPIKISRTHLLVHPGYMCENLPAGGLLAYRELWRRIIQYAASLCENDLLVCAPSTGWTSPTEREPGEELTLEDLLNYPDEMYLTGKVDSDDFTPQLLIDHLRTLLRERLIVVEADIPASRLGDTSSKLVSSAGFTFAEGFELIAFGEYLTLCVREYAVAFAEHYGAGKPSLLVGLSSLPVEAAAKGWTMAETLRAHLRYDNPDDDWDRNMWITACLEAVTFSQAWVTDVFREFAE